MKRCVIVVLILVTMMVLSGYAVLEAGSAEPIVPKEKIIIFNGKDFSGWKLFVEDAEHDVTKTWSVKDGVIRCEGQPAGYMRTEADYTDYLFHIEWRWPEGRGNSGVLVHMSGPDIVWPKSIECQLYAGHAGDFLVIGEGPQYLKGVNIEQRVKGGPRVKNRKVAKLKESSEKSIGEWNVYEIICKDDWMVVLVNGVLQNVATKATITSGKICLQSEGRPIEFRNIYIEPVE